MLTEIVPGLKRVAMIFNSDTAPGRGTYYFRDFEAAARSSKLEPIAADARSDAEIETVVTLLGGEPRGGLVVTPDYFMLNHCERIISQAARTNVPTVYPWKSVVARQGGLLSYGPDLLDIVRRSAPYVDKILRFWDETDMPKYLGDVRSQGQSGKHLLGLSFSGFDPTETLAVHCATVLKPVSALSEYSF